MNIIVGKNKAVALGMELECPVYRISERRFCVTAICQHGKPNWIQ